MKMHEEKLKSKIRTRQKLCVCVYVSEKKRDIESPIFIKSKINGCI